MRFSTFLGLTSLLLAGDGLATDSIDICPIENAATCGCPSNPSKRFVVPGRVSADRLFRRTGEACSDGKPACCTEKGPGPLEVSPGTSQTDLQCGTKFGDDNLDVTNGVVYNIEDCPATGLYAGQSCLHVVLSPAPGVIVKDIHLQVDDSLITVNTKLGTWAFNKYCTTAPSECWVPVDAIKATFGSPPDSLCDKAIYVAAGISVSDTVSAATCFNKGTTIGSGNWFMYFTLKLECPEVCLHQCCCPPPPPPPSKSCTVGTAFGYGDGFINLNGKPVGPALGGTGCNRWGWYFTPSKASLQDGISGDLIVGAGGNDVSKGIYVGTWTAKLEASQITFEYTLFDDNDKGHFDLAEVHVYASCNKPPTCAPGQYTYTSPAGDLTGDSDTSIRKSIDVDGSCSSYYLIFHATVNELVPESEACGGAVE